MTHISKREALRLAVALAAVAITTRAGAQPTARDRPEPSDDDIRKLIAERNAPRPGQGIAIGVLEPGGQRIVAGGTGAGASVGAETLFQIGSITKVFTALLLADMANKGEVLLDDPAAKYLPEGCRMPERGPRPISLRDLATHRSGLPAMADDMRGVSHPDGPFADYTEERLLAFLGRHQLTREPGSQWEYSNIGMGLLGYLLGRAKGSDYESLVRTRITGPLRMNDTMITVPPTHVGRLATGFDAYMRPIQPWPPAILVGVGSIRSTATDMLIFAQAVLDPTSPIAPAMKTALAVRTPSANPRIEQALGWWVRHPAAGPEQLMHDGLTGGFSSILILEPATGRAVVALVNSATPPGPLDLARHILAGSPVDPTPAVPPAPPPFVVRTEITLPAAELDKFAGRYDFGSGVVVAITRDGGFLYAQREGVAGALRLQILPEAPQAFFWNAMDAQIRFTTDASGEVTGAVLTQGGQMVGRRLAP